MTSDTIVTEPQTEIPAEFAAPEARYINREISWLQFNSRVLEEANNKTHPIMERLRFLSICGNNLDEFYMVRVSGLRELLQTKSKVLSVDGLLPLEQLERINDVAGN